MLIRPLPARPLAALVVVCGSVTPVILANDAVSAEFRVGATVLARAVKLAETRPERIAVTQADIQRGYVELSEPFTISVQTNDRAGYLLQLGFANGPFERVQLLGEPFSADIRTGGSWIAVPYTGLTPSQTSFRVRIVLEENAEPGTYDWPLSAAVVPASQPGQTPLI